MSNGSTNNSDDFSSFKSAFKSSIYARVSSVCVLWGLSSGLIFKKACWFHVLVNASWLATYQLPFSRRNDQKKIKPVLHVSSQTRLTPTLILQLFCVSFGGTLLSGFTPVQMTTIGGYCWENICRVQRSIEPPLCLYCSQICKLPPPPSPKPLTHYTLILPHHIFYTVYLSAFVRGSRFALPPSLYGCEPRCTKTGKQAGEGVN